MTDQTSPRTSDTGASVEARSSTDFGEILRRIVVKTPTEDELYASCRPWYERNSSTFIDRWPDYLRALSFPTVLVPFDAARFCKLWGHEHEILPVAAEVAAVLDEHMGWNNWFVRLNTRSPKDAAYPALPVTCSGKQAVSWIMGSERCLDDSTALKAARAPLFVCLRQYHHMRKEGEFRCFAKDGEVLGMTRYFYDEEPHPDFTPDAEKLLGAARAFFDAHLAGDYPTVVFDLYAPGSEAHERLIEINPYGLSDPCLFNGYAEIESVGGFRWERRSIGAPPALDSPGMNTNPKSSPG